MSSETRPRGKNLEPRAQPAARYVAVVIGVGLLTVAAICGRELWLRHDPGVDWRSWIDPVVLTVGSATFQPWMLPAGIVAAVAGAVLMWIGVRPRTRTHRRVDSSTSLWTRPVDIARMASSQARRATGVLSAHSQLNGGNLVVTISGGENDDGLASRVEATLSELIDDLGLPLTLRVRVRPHTEVTR